MSLESPANADASASVSSRSRRTRRIRVLAVAFVVLGTLYAAGAFGLIPRQLARGALDVHDPEAALSSLAWARWLGPPSGEVEFLTARAHRKLGQLEAVPRELRRALELGYPRSAIHREELLARAQAGDLSEISRDLNQMLVEPGADGPHICEAYANGLLAIHQFELAELVLENWEQAYPDDPGPHLLRGRMLQFRDEHTAAEAEYESALKKQPGFTRAAFHLGRLKLDQNQPQEAVPYFERCLGGILRGPAMLNLARCDLRLGNTDPARERLKRVAALDPAERDRAGRFLGEPEEFDSVALELGRLELAENRPEKAIEWFRRALAKNENDVDARYSLGLALRQVGKAEEAQQELERANAARAALSEVGELLGKLREQPDSAEIRRRIGALFLEHGSARTALFWLNSALADNPDDPPTHRLLAEYYEKQARENPEFKSLAEQHRAKAGR